MKKKIMFCIISFIMMFSLIFWCTNKTQSTYAIGDEEQSSEVTPLTLYVVSYNGVIYYGENVDFSLLYIVILYSNNSLEELDPLSEVKYYYNDNLIEDINNFSLNSENTTIVVKWAENETFMQEWNVYVENGFKVSFNANGGSGEMNDVLHQHDEYTLPVCTYEAPENSIFDGYEINGQKYNVGDNITINDDTEVKVLWKDTTSGSETQEPSEPSVQDQEEPATSEESDEPTIEPKQEATNNTEKTSKKSSAKIIIIVVISVVVLAGAGFSVYYFLIKKKRVAKKV